MKPFGGWSVWNFGLILSIVWLLRFKQVGARLRCFECEMKMKSPASTQDPCFDPKNKGAKTDDCPTGGSASNVLACYKLYDKDKENDNSSYFLERSCTYIPKDQKPCYTVGGQTRCFCNDRDLCNDEVGYEVTKYNFQGLTNNGIRTVTATARSRLLQAVLVFLST